MVNVLAKSSSVRKGVVFTFLYSRSRIIIEIAQQHPRQIQRFTEGFKVLPYVLSQSGVRASINSTANPLPAILLNNFQMNILSMRFFD